MIDSEAVRAIMGAAGESEEFPTIPAIPPTPAFIGAPPPPGARVAILEGAESELFIRLLRDSGGA